MEVSQECSDSSVATGIRTVTTGLQICLGKRATFLNNEIGPYCDNPLNAPIIRKVAILDGSLDLIQSTRAPHHLELGIATSPVSSASAQLLLVDERCHRVEGDRFRDQG